MPFDDKTRNRLAGFVNDVRELLKSEFAEQLQRVYGISSNGDVTAMADLRDLDEEQRSSAELLRARIDYLRASSKTEEASSSAAIDRLTREQSFTVLNRLAAIRMAEKRGFIVESVGHGYQSKGFQVYGQIAGRGLGDMFQRYRRYLICLFDELSSDLGALFDTRSPTCILFPREPALIKLFEMINAPEIDVLWAEDETIGWIYQYFNSKEERQQMRKESVAPRNSRELAVRNQFFTPRYVVEFLVDNTLGRIWYEMQRGRTRLKEHCRYLVRRPIEVFLGDPFEANRRLHGEPQPGWEIPRSVSAAYLGDLSLITQNMAPFERWVALAIPPDQFGSIGGQEHGTVNESLLLNRVFNAIENEPESPLLSDVLSIWTAMSCFVMASSGSPYDREPFEKLWNIFVKAAHKQTSRELSREHLLTSPAYIPYRPKKDPRDLKLLDPAVGSGHFLLYSFDLLLVIYEEAWRDDQSAEFTETKRTLREEYPDIETLRRQLPELILRHNLHGIDIDLRACQIAALALWLRTQRVWHEHGLDVAARPRIRRSNIVCAEPMPGEPEMLAEFVSRLQPRVLGELVRRVFDAMNLAGETGPLLKIEEAIGTAVVEAKKQWLSISKPEQATLFGDSRPLQKELAFDFTGITDQVFWEEAEERIYTALDSYAEHAEKGSDFQRRLFGDDAARGFSFIDVCRRRYDVILMNPPFGEQTDVAKSYAKLFYRDSGEDIDPAFVDRGIEILYPGGKLGIIGNRTALFKGVLSDWRGRLFHERSSLEALADLGYGVLDGAVVEAAAYVLGKGPSRVNSAIFVRALDTEDKEGRLATELGRATLQSGKSVFVQRFNFFAHLPGKRVAYWITPAFSRSFSRFPALEGNHGYARQGLASADNFRFVRLFWESKPDKIRLGTEPDGLSLGSPAPWVNFAKGGEYSPYFQDVHLLINWNGEGRELSAFEGSVIRNPTFYFHEALTYSERTASGFSPRALPKGCIFDSKGPIIAAVKREDLSPLLGFLMSKAYATFLEFLVAAGDSAVSGTAARQYTQSIVGSVPVPQFEAAVWKKIGHSTEEIWKLQCKKDAVNETGRFFALPAVLMALSNGLHNSSLSEILNEWVSHRDKIDNNILERSFQIEQAVRTAYDFDSATNAEIDSEFGVHVKALPNTSVNPEDFARCYAMPIDTLVGTVLADSGGRRAVTKKTYFADRKLELLCLHFDSNVDMLLKLRADLRLLSKDDVEELTRSLCSYLLGSTFGRWDLRFATREKTAPDLPDPFTSLAVCPPGMLQNEQGRPLSQEDMRRYMAIGKWNYPIQIQWDGILVDDPGHPMDVETRVRHILELIAKGRAEAAERDICESLGFKALRDYFREPTGFFDDHLKRYSKSRRQAPIYWPLSTRSGGYTIWIYHSRLNSQTLHVCLADFLDPKLRSISDKIRSTRQSATAQKQLGELLEFEDELKEMRNEINRLIKLPYEPNSDDGVLIAACPLWRLFRLPKWQRDLKNCWEELEQGDYDWSRLAYSIWPDRIREKCKIDRSVAIAQGLENLYVTAEPRPKSRGRTKESKPVEKDAL